MKNCNTLLIELMLVGFIFSNSSASAAAQIGCKDVKYENPNYHENMDKLASLAKLPNAYWSKYHEDIVGDLCKGTPQDIESINQTVDAGYVTTRDAEAIAQVLGINFNAKPRTAKGIKYEKINQGLIARGFCYACASNIASAATELGDKDFDQIVIAALNGDSFAKKELEPLSDIYGRLLNLNFSETYALKWAAFYVKGSRLYINNLIDSALNGDMLDLAKLRNISEINDNITLPEEDVVDVSENTYVLFFTLLMHGNTVNYHCEKNWRLCSDNKEIVEWRRKEIVSSCKSAAKTLAQYNEPSFNANAFPKYIVGIDYAKSGYVMVFDNDVKFSNAFGTLVNTKIACAYDLNTSKVTDIRPFNIK